MSRPVRMSRMTRVTSAPSPASLALMPKISLTAPSAARNPSICSDARRPCLHGAGPFEGGLGHGRGDAFAQPQGDEGGDGGHDLGLEVGGPVESEADAERHDGL